MARATAANAVHIDTFMMAGVSVTPMLRVKGSQSRAGRTHFDLKVKRYDAGASEPEIFYG